MSLPISNENIDDTIKNAIIAAIPGAQATVQNGGGGHFRLRVVSAVFAGKTALQKQRLVLNAIAHLMKGDGAPVHAIDAMETLEG